MRGCGAGRPDALRGLLLFGLCIALASCVPAATPTAIPRPTPDPLDVYLMMADRYTSYSVIATIYEMSADDAARILRALQAIEAPPALQTLHEQAVEAYKHICYGKLLFPGADPVLRSEAYFEVDWGIALLMGYREHVDAEDY